MTATDAPTATPTRFPADFKPRPRYPGTCCGCGEQSDFPVTFTMRHFGWNTGHGTCPHCKAALHLVLDIESQHLLSEPHALYLKRREAAG